MAIPDAASEFLVKLAVDDAFRKKYNDTPANERTAFLHDNLTNFDGLAQTVKDALVATNISVINEHVFINQQTSFTAARSMVKALDAFLATLESETKTPQ